jgi:hypothetical protein
VTGRLDWECRRLALAGRSTDGVIVVAAVVTLLLLQLLVVLRVATVSAGNVRAAGALVALRRASTETWAALPAHCQLSLPSPPLPPLGPSVARPPGWRGVQPVRLRRPGLGLEEVGGGWVVVEVEVEVEVVRKARWLELSKPTRPAGREPQPALHFHTSIFWRWAASSSASSSASSPLLDSSSPPSPPPPIQIDTTSAWLLSTIGWAQRPRRSRWPRS